MTKRSTLLLSLITLGVIFITACIPPFPDFSLRYSGGGFMASAVDPGEKANFGFHYDGTTEPPKIHGTYHDKAAGVRIRFTGVVQAYSGDGDPNKCMVAEILYKPLGNKLIDGMGGVVACDKVNEGEIPVGGSECESYPCDFLAIIIATGQYGGYMNSGQVIGGNLKNLD